MAETVHLYLKANGTDIKGESTQTSLGRQDSIECVYYEQGVKTAREAGSGMATGELYRMTSSGRYAAIAPVASELTK